MSPFCEPKKKKWRHGVARSAPFLGGGRCLPCSYADKPLTGPFFLYDSLHSPVR